MLYEVITHRGEGEAGDRRGGRIGREDQRGDQRHRSRRSLGGMPDRRPPLSVSATNRGCSGVAFPRPMEAGWY